MLADAKGGLKPRLPGPLRTLVLFPGALGDAVCVEPAVARLAARGPVDLYARGAAAEIAALFPARPRVHSLDRPEIARLFAPLGDAAEERAVAAWLAPFDRIVSFTGSESAEVRARLAGTGRAVLAPFPRGRVDGHASDHFLRHAVAEPGALAPPPRLVLDAVGEPALRGRAVLAIHPGAGAVAKRAPRGVFAAVARRWRESRAGDVLVLAGPAERDAADTWGDLGRVVLPATVADLAVAIAAASAFLGNDSGPGHVAAALGVPSVALFVAGDRSAFAPRGASAIALSIEGAEPEEVAQSVERHLQAVCLDSPGGRH